MYLVKATAVNRPVVMCWEVWGRGTFYSPVIRSLSFRDPVHLHCELHKCVFQFFPPHFSETGGQIGVSVMELGTSLPHVS